MGCAQEALEAAAAESVEEEEPIKVIISGVHGEQVASLELPGDATVLDCKVALSADTPLHTQKLLLANDVCEDQLELAHLRGHAELLELLLVKLSFDEAQSRQLLIHAWRGEVEDVERCLRARACPDHRSEEDGRTALLSAALQGHIE
ncbi:unnamed protein product, partial [Effrenium voratum]